MDLITSGQGIDERPVALTVAGSDPGGGAGIQADLRVFNKLGLFGLSVISSITAQNTKEVREVYPSPPEQVAAQLKAVSEDFSTSVAKTGMLPTAEIVEVVASWFKSNKAIPLVIDPVYRSSSGFRLVDHDAIMKAVELLWPLCDLITPNAYEAGVIAGSKIDNVADARDVARALNSMGAKAVCITGGAWGGGSLDIYYDGESFEEISGERINIRADYHGTGCIYSAAAAGYLALGRDTLSAVNEARQLVETAIKNALCPGGGMAVPWL